MPQTPPRRAVAGHAVAGHAVAGHAVAGHAVAGHAVAGHAVAGHAGAGHAGVGRSRPARQRPARQRPARQRPAQPAAADHAAADRASALDRALAAALAAPEPAAPTFASLGLPAPLADALAGRGLHVPFPIQTRTVPDALAGRDVLGRAQTGSGKTLAFGLPVLARLAGSAAPRPGPAPRALILAPTRELVRQIAGVLAPLAEPMGLRLATIHGGVPIGPQLDQARRGMDVVLATPGRLIDLLDRGACRLDRIEVTVLDEADHLADLGFLPAVRRILQATPAGGQRLLFSATLDRDVERLVASYLHDPAVHAVGPAARSAPAADHHVLIVPAADKVAVTAEIAGRHTRTLLFVRTRRGADRLARQLHRAGVKAGAIHGNLKQSQRQRVLAGFTTGDPQVLVATNVAARGIHIDDLDLVIHYDPPNDHKDYLHRSGRTARAGARGSVVSLVEPSQLQDLTAMHRVAGITATSRAVQPGDTALHGAAAAPPPRATRPPATTQPAPAKPTAAKPTAAQPPRQRTNSRRRRPGQPRPAGNARTVASGR
jgi:superfamily II DNA/RNA helicase